jgi:hypothetical protein
VSPFQPVIAAAVASAEKQSVIHAADTTGASGIKIQSGYRDLFAADEAVTIVASLYATQCAVDFLQLNLPSSGRFLCHLLGLQSVHARQAANLRLVKCHGASGFFTVVNQLFDVIPERY